MTSHIAFFGDAEHGFKLPGSLIPELERKLDDGIGSISRRVMKGNFHYAEIIEIVRLGLVGGGMSPKDAAELIATYADKTPISEMFLIAVAIIELKLTGAITKIEDTADE